MNEVITNDRQKCDQALEALEDVIDPEIGLNIVDLGLLYQIDFDEGNKIIFISMTLTTQFCPMGDSIRSKAGQAMQNAFPEYTIDIELVFDPPWHSNRISEEGKQFLNRE
jgi:metal-sulfur cluster biosynthetic enzyme